MSRTELGPAQPDAAGATGALDPGLANAPVCIMSAGSVNPSTVFLSCVANSDNFDIEAAVAVAALPV